jgi:hypothetical protein
MFVGSVKATTFGKPSPDVAALVDALKFREIALAQTLADQARRLDALGRLWSRAHSPPSASVAQTPLPGKFWPPSATSTVPVTYDASGEARKTAT